MEIYKQRLGRSVYHSPTATANFSGSLSQNWNTAIRQNTRFIRWSPAAQSQYCALATKFLEQRLPEEEISLNSVFERIKPIH